MIVIRQLNELCLFHGVWISLESNKYVGMISNTDFA